MSFNLQQIATALKFLDGQLGSNLEIALTHPSYLYEQRLTRNEKDEQERDYRRLAHLGDSLVNSIVTQYLYIILPSATSGELTNQRQRLVDSACLAKFAKQARLPQLCLLGRGEKNKPIQNQERLFAEMFEAVVAAIYLDNDRDFSETYIWLVEEFVQNEAQAPWTVKQSSVENGWDGVVSDRDYLDMIGLENFSEYGWMPGDDDLD